jgi:hypothetical protein
MRSLRVPLIAATALCAGICISSAKPGDPKPPAKTKPAAEAPARPGKPAPRDPFATPDENEEPGPPVPRECLVRVEVFALPQDNARFAQRKYRKQTDLYAWLEGELANANAVVKLERMDILRIRGGQRSKLQCVNEYPYPTEFDPGQIPQTVGLGMSATIYTNPTTAPQIVGPKTVPPPAPAPAPAPAPGPKGDPEKPGPAGASSGFSNPGPPGSVPSNRVFPPWPYSSCTPTAYATRNTGWTCEIELTIGEEGKNVDLNIAPEFSKPAGWEVYHICGEEVQPIFETRKLTAQILTPMGQPTLAGTFNRPPLTGAGGADKDDVTRLLFFTVTPIPPIPLPPVPKDDQPPADPLAGPASEGPREGLVNLEAFSLPPDVARKAVITNPDETVLYTWLDSELARKDSGVALEHTSTLRVRSGQRSKTEALNEFPYGTEFDPPQIPQTISLVPGNTPAPVPGTETIFPPWPFTSTNASAFATKNLGWTTEIELTFGEDGTADVNLEPEFSRLAGKSLFGANKDIMQPIFESQRFNGQVTVPPGQPALVCTFTPPTGTGIPGANTSDRVWLLFVRVNHTE